MAIGEDAFFPCNGTNNGTTAQLIPSQWGIGDNVYAIRNLPVNYYFNASGLLAIKVNSSMNGWAYSCYFTVFRSEEMEFIDIESTRGFLTVVNRSIATGKLIDVSHTRQCVFILVLACWTKLLIYTVVHDHMYYVLAIYFCCSTLQYGISLQNL